LILFLLFILMPCMQLPVHAEDNARFLHYLTILVDRVRCLSTGKVLVVPGGWAFSGDGGGGGGGQQPVGRAGQQLLFLVQRRERSFSLAVINTGTIAVSATGGDGDGARSGSGSGLGGLEFHPARPCPSNPALVERNMSLCLHDIPLERLTDSSFWYLALRLLVFPADTHSGCKTDAECAHRLYNCLLPSLNNKPLMANVPSQISSGGMQQAGAGASAGEGEEAVFWSVPPRGGDPSGTLCSLLCIQQAMSWSGLTEHQTHSLMVMVDWSLTQLVHSDLSVVKRLSPSDFRLVELGCQRLAHNATLRAHGMQLSPQQLAGIYDDIRSIRTCAWDLFHKTDPSLPPPLSLPASGLRVSGAAVQPMFGRLRCDVDLDQLVGRSAKPTVLLPVEVTLIPDTVNNYDDVCRALRQCVHVCTLLANQCDLIKNTYCIRTSLIQHLFTRVLPMPLPYNHPDRSRRCFWSCAPMRYADQADILRQLNLVCRHFSVASLSLKVTRSFDAARILTMAAIATVADAVLRIKASDVPSVFSLHYDGTADGPVHPYGFEMGHFAVEADFQRFYSPELATTLTQVLDYHTQRRASLRDDHVIFQFERSMAFGPNDQRLMQQLCLQMGFPTTECADQLAEYFTGTTGMPEVIDTYAELAYFRDIVFMFKALMAPTSEALPEVKRWKPRQAALHWKFKPDKDARRAALKKQQQQQQAAGVVTDECFGSFEVTAFGRKMECAFLSDKQPSGLSRFFEMFSRSDVTPRVPPSAGDPSILAGQKIVTEDDVLHIRHLPDFGVSMQARDCELLLTMLTAPYLRIPLVMQFFACPERIQALNSDELRCGERAMRVVWCAVYCGVQCVRVWRFASCVSCGHHTYLTLIYSVNPHPPPPQGSA
jgi:hypothetical protein